MDNNDTQMNGPKRAKKRYGSRPIAFIALATSIEIEKKGGFWAESIYIFGGFIVEMYNIRSHLHS